MQVHVGILTTLYLLLLQGLSALLQTAQGGQRQLVLQLSRHADGLRVSPIVTALSGAVSACAERSFGVVIRNYFRLEVTTDGGTKTLRYFYQNQRYFHSHYHFLNYLVKMK